MARRFLNVLSRSLRITIDAYNHFNDSDGWAIASHIALSVLLALFPFLILVTSLAASFFGSKELADEVARLLLETWPAEVAKPLAEEIRDVLTTVRGDVLTISFALAVFFASSGIESLRIGLTRAYGRPEKRRWFVLRLESILYVLVGALALLALAFLIVLGPLLMTTASKLVPALTPFEWNITVARYTVASVILIVALMVAHKWLPAGRRRVPEVAPGIVVTLILWLASGMIFGRYLAEFPTIYASYYGGLASAMMALVFLYLTSTIFVFGGELNAAILRMRADRGGNPMLG